MLFFPATPPNTSNGDVTSIHIRRITRMVPKGKAAVALYAMATVLRKQNVKNSGPQNKQPVSKRFLTYITKWTRPDLEEIIMNQNIKFRLIESILYPAGSF